MTGLHPPELENGRQAAFRSAAFRRTLVRWTALYWTGVYLLLTLRSIVRPRGHILIQAGLRLVMMGVAISITAALYQILKRLDLRTWPARIAVYAALGLLAEFTYALINFYVFYEMPGLWVPEAGFAAKIGSYLIEFFWLFVGWLLLFELAMDRHAGKAAGAVPSDSLWIGPRAQQTRLPTDSIDLVEAERDYVRIHAAGRTHLHRSTMASIEQALDPRRFVRIHRGFIVAVRLLRSVTRKPDGSMKVTLEDGRELPIGRNYVERVRALTLPPDTGADD